MGATKSKGFRLALLALAVLCATCSERTGRAFSLFNIVKFKNNQCATASDPTMSGTCFTNDECRDMGGTSDGRCASGFGVCCMFSLTQCTGGVVTQNCTYLQNAGYPTTDTETSETCSYSIARIQEALCQIRLDFDTATLLTDNTEDGRCGNDVGDSLTVTSGFSGEAGAFPPTVCGTLTGQHMYFETGTSGNAGEVTIEKGSRTGSRSWKIKVTYLECYNIAKAPTGCTQYFTGISGTVQTYNFDGDQLLQTQNYGSCIRQEEGFCSFQLTESPAATPDPFDLSAPGDMAETTACNILSHIIVPGTNNVDNMQAPAGTDTICGGVLSNRDESSNPAAIIGRGGTPFQIGTRTLTAALTGLSGYSLQYTQIPCQS